MARSAILQPEELKGAEELCRRVNCAGGMVLLAAGRLRVVQPRGGLPVELRTAIRRHKTALVQYVRCGRELTPEYIEQLCEPDFVGEWGRFWIKRVESSVPRRRIGEMCPQCCQIVLPSGCGCEEAS